MKTGFQLIETCFQLKETCFQLMDTCFQQMEPCLLQMESCVFPPLFVNTDTLRERPFPSFFILRNKDRGGKGRGVQKTAQACRARRRCVPFGLPRVAWHSASTIFTLGLLSEDVTGTRKKSNGRKEAQEGGAERRKLRRRWRRRSRRRRSRRRRTRRRLR